ncbi:MAG: hypothetical protein E7B59_15630 [Enterobacteriaceae bacterium]|nr:hypothetical protein [Enterobacteriaceae bacterium]
MPEDNTALMPDGDCALSGLESIKVNAMVDPDRVSEAPFGRLFT